MELRANFFAVEVSWLRKENIGNLSCIKNACAVLLFCSLRLLFYHVLVENLGLMVSMEVINDTKYPKKRPGYCRRCENKNEQDNTKNITIKNLLPSLKSTNFCLVFFGEGKMKQSLAGKLFTLLGLFDHLETCEKYEFWLDVERFRLVPENSDLVIWQWATKINYYRKKKKNN